MWCVVCVLNCFEKGRLQSECFQCCVGLGGSSNPSRYVCTSDLTAPIPLPTTPAPLHPTHLCNPTPTKRPVRKQGALTNGSVNAFYSTPNDYASARRQFYSGPWPLKTDDFMPYADCPHCYWTGAVWCTSVAGSAATVMLLQRA